MKNTILALTIVAGASISHEALGFSDHQLVITENSSTSLTATFDGAPLAVTFVPGFPDSWSIANPNFTTPAFPHTPQWFEPGSTSTENGNFALGGAAGSFILVGSDTMISALQGPILPNGGTFIAAGTDILDGVPVDITFNDNGDAAHGVPDTGSTFGLLSLSLIALLGASRIRSLRLA